MKDDFKEELTFISKFAAKDDKNTYSDEQIYKIVEGLKENDENLDNIVVDFDDKIAYGFYFSSGKYTFNGERICEMQVNVPKNIVEYEQIVNNLNRCLKLNGVSKVKKTNKNKLKQILGAIAIVGGLTGGISAFVNAPNALAIEQNANVENHIEFLKERKLALATEDNGAILNQKEIEEIDKQIKALEMEKQNYTEDVEQTHNMRIN